MAGRLNKVIELLELGKVVFGGGMVLTGNVEEARAYSDLGYDFIIFETEHEGFDVAKLSLSLQFLLDRKRIVLQGTPQPDPVPFVRIAPNAREHNQWVIKQALDTGVFGLVLPHIDTVEQARSAVIACRYPQELGAPDFEPIGQRGLWHRVAPRYWGLNLNEYYRRADLWPLDAQGELLLILLVEGVEGVRNIHDILDQVKGIGAVWVGPGDLSVELGVGPNTTHPKVEEAIQHVLKTCRGSEVPCAIFTGPKDVEKRIEQGFRIIMSGPVRLDTVLQKGKALTAR